jgi:nicotinamide-nucleotide amidase
MSFLTAEQADLARSIADLLIARQQTVAVAESSTGGLISAALLSIPGASAYYRGGGVLYTYDARDRLAGLSRDDQSKHRGSTPDLVLAFSEALRARLDATWAVGEAGVAGPTGSRYGWEAGHVALGVVGPVQRGEVVETGNPDRVANMVEFTTRALRLFLAALKESS